MDNRHSPTRAPHNSDGTASHCAPDFFRRLPTFITWIALVVVTSVLVRAPFMAATAPSPRPAPPLTVTFFDVGQGDATLFQGPDFTILIDAGRHDRNDMVGHLQQSKVGSIDLFIMTHPHADHIGQCDTVMQRFSVNEVWMSGDLHTTRTFERCIDAILESDAGYYEPRAGESFHIGSAYVEVLHPASLTGNLNNGSIVVRITFGNARFLMTGDAEKEGELAMITRGYAVDAHVLKLGHHGSSTSSIPSFVDAVNPALAVYSAGRDNEYGHPHRETLRTMEQLGVPLYGTPESGTLWITTDGESELTVHTDTGTYVTPLTTQATAAIPAVNTSTDHEYEIGCLPEQVDINRASTEMLTRMERIGDVLANRIVEARPFATLEELTRVSGIGEKTLQAIVAQQLACVGAY